MARDYKSRQDHPRHRRRGGSCFFWFVTGALLGALGVAVAWMMEGLKETEASRTQPPEQATQSAPRPRFDYHSILPEMEVVVPDEELTDDRPPALPPPPPEPEEEAAAADSASPPPPAQPPTQTVKAAPKAPSGDGTAYLLQVGSFKSSADAERLKAKLALLGMSSSIQKVTINGKDTYHRVRAGPYRGRDALNQARALLARNGLESMAIKLK
jgi:cell division protein FtsN